MNDSKRLFKAVAISFMLVLLFAIIYSIPIIGPFLKVLSDSLIFAFSVYIIYELLEKK